MKRKIEFDPFHRRKKHRRKTEEKREREREERASASASTMHGRKREPKEVKYSEKRVEAKKKKAKLYGQLSKQVHERCIGQKNFDEDSLMLSAKLLEMNCELYSLWNYRKEYLKPKLQGEEGEEGERRALVGKELKLVEAALQKNPKSYATWQHRKWVVAHKNLVDLKHELALCQMLLAVDERNFHCWSYRRYVVKLSETDPEDELEFTTEKILQNFSNYSSWHYRSALLPEVNKVTTLDELIKGDQGDAEKDEGKSKEQILPLHVLDQEFKLVKEAFFTEPEDQSSWLYHSWLMSHLTRGEDKFGATEVDKHVEEEITTCQEILEIEPDCKWPLLTLARLFELQARRASAGETKQQLKGKVKDLYNKLATLDVMRKGYYRDAAAAL